MDSRKIFEIYKLINDRSIKPVSAWPSIADIPIGATVLDSDVVIKRCGDVSGSIWQTRTRAADNNWRALTECTLGAWAGRLVAVAYSGTGNCVMTSDDGGITWQTRTSAADNDWRALTECTSGAWAGRLVAVAYTGTGNRVMTSDDGGTTWKTRTSAADNNWRALTECTLGAWAGRLVAVSEYGTGNRVMTSDLKKELRKI